MSNFIWSLLGSFGVTAEMLYPENIAQAAGGLAAFLAVVGSGVHIVRHLVLNKTKLRRCTVRILLVVPIFSADCFASLLLETVPGLGEMLSSIREVYEAVALASFLQLILTVLGGPHSLKDKLIEAGGKPVYHLGPLRYIPGLREPYRAGPEFVASMISGIFQYIIMMLVVLFLKFIILEMAGPHSLLMVIPNVVKSASCAWALNCIVLFSHEVYEHLPSLNLFRKFMSIKGIVFFTFWQGIAINVLQQLGVLSILTKYIRAKAENSHLQDLWWNDYEIRSGLNDFLLCGEMLFFCVLHWVAYPVRERQDLTLQHGRTSVAERDWTIGSRILAKLYLLDMADMYSQVEALRNEVHHKRRASDTRKVPGASSSGPSGFGAPLLHPADPKV